MIAQYLIKYLTASGRYTNHDPSNDVFEFKGVKINGVLFDDTNIVTVSGVNSMTAAIAAAEADLNASIATLSAEVTAVSGASSARDDSQDATIAANYTTLNNKIDAVSGASSARDDSQDATIASNYSTLQGEITSILADRAKEERFEAVSGQTTFTLSTIVFDPSTSVHDIEVFKNGLKMFQSETGSLAGVSGGDFVKVGTNQVQFLYGLKDGDRVIVRDERTGGGVDLTDVTTDILPDASGVRNLGSATKAWEALYLKDAATAAIWELQVVSGTIQVTQVG